MYLVCSRLQVVGAVSQSSLSGQIFTESVSSILKPGLCSEPRSVHTYWVFITLMNWAYCAIHCLILFHEFCLLFAVILIVVSVCTATGAWNWLIDPDTQKVCEIKRCYKWGQISIWCHIPLVCILMSSLSTGFFLLIFMESSVFHYQLCDSHWPFLCWNT